MKKPDARKMKEGRKEKRVFNVLCTWTNSWKEFNLYVLQTHTNKVKRKKKKSKYSVANFGCINNNFRLSFLNICFNLLIPSSIKSFIFIHIKIMHLKWLIWGKNVFTQGYKINIFGCLNLCTSMYFQRETVHIKHRLEKIGRRKKLLLAALQSF